MTLSGPALLTGSVIHERVVDASHRFRYRLFMLCLDLTNLKHPAQKHWWLAFDRLGIASVRRSDFLPDTPGSTIADAVRHLIQERTGESFTGEIYLLAQPRWFGFIMNPLSLYFCQKNGKITHIVGEITNTPWGERYCYLMSRDQAELTRESLTFKFDKVFHVSPFLPMDMSYTWKFNFSESGLTLTICNFKETKKQFVACLHLKQQHLTARNTIRHFAISPWMTVKIAAGIYWQAAILYFFKKVTFFDHPRMKSDRHKEHACQRAK